MSAQLEALASQAEAVDAAAANDAEGAEALGQEPKDEAPPAPGNFEAIGFLLAAFVQVGSMVLKVNSLRTTLGEREIETCARVLAPVADKYGLQLGNLMSGGPELVALMTAGPILWGAWKQLDMELKARRAKPVEPAGDGQAPAASTVADGE